MAEETRTSGEQMSGATVQSDRVKVYEEKKTKAPAWLWLLPLLLLLAVGVWMLTRHHTAAVPAAHNLGTVNFDTDQATLTANSKTTLDNAAHIMQQKPDMRLRVQGFTDSAGDMTHNVALSNQRSEAVTQYLASAGIDRSRVMSEGFGDSKPVASNSTTEGKADNRRVELFEQ